MCVCGVVVCAGTIEWGTKYCWEGAVKLMHDMTQSNN